MTPTPANCHLTAVPHLADWQLNSLESSEEQIFIQFAQSRLSHVTTLCLQSPLGWRDCSKRARASQGPCARAAAGLRARDTQREHQASTYSAGATSCLGGNISDTFTSWKNHRNISPEQSGQDEAITNPQPAPTLYPYSSGCFWSSTTPCLRSEPFLS